MHTAPLRGQLVYTTTSDPPVSTVFFRFFSGFFRVFSAPRYLVFYIVRAAQFSFTSAARMSVFLVIYFI